jgi:hypothetical protein
VIPFRRFNEVAAIAASFAVGYAITLIASAYGYAPDQLWFPSLIGTLMAIATFYMALENLVGPKLERRWPLTFGAGLIQGFGFSLGLRQVLQFAGTHALTAVFSFTVGIALGLLLLLILVIPALGVAFKLIVTERLGAIILSALAAHAAWHWMIDRGDLLRQYRFEWPALDLVFWIAAMRWAMLGVIAAGLYWIIFGVLRPRAKNLELKT